MNAIVAVDQNWGIGYQNQLLCRNQKDMEYFKNMTTNKIVIMGRETLESLPNGKPLTNRINIVLTKNKKLQVEDCKIIHHLDDLLKVISQFSKDDIFVIGGESIYNQLLPYCDTIYVTKIQAQFCADAYFPNLDKMKLWNVVNQSESYTFHYNEEELLFRFYTYKRMNMD